MKVLDPRQPDADERHDADALFEEARSRQRRRRWVIAMVVLVLAAGAGVWAVSGGGAGRKPPSSSKKPGHVKPSRPAGSAKKSATSVSIAFDGKYGISPPAFPTASEGFVDIGGFLGGNGPNVSWLERTTNGGRTWLIEPNFDQSNVAFNSATDGWLYGGKLYKTTDAGLLAASQRHGAGARSRDPRQIHMGR